jgi:tripartite-type tricarboxylate transporter receptor subunit TctC
MKLPHRRQFLHLAAATAALPALSTIARAQAYPTRPVRIIVGFPAGGSADFHARLIGQWLSQRLNQQFVVDNRPGAGGNIGTEAVVRAPADGYTLLLAATPNAINATLYDRLNFNFIRDIAPVAGIVHGPQVLVMHPAHPSKSVSDIIAYAKANPAKLNMASGGNGTPNHIAGELFKIMAGVNLTHVSYRGEGPALTDVISGQVQLMFVSGSVSLEFIRAGKLRAVAVTTPVRSPALPDVPTITETVPGYEAHAWAGMGAPKGTPPEIIEELNGQINAGLASPAIKARYANLGLTPLILSPSDYGKFVAEDTQRWAKVIRAANIKVE